MIFFFGFESGLWKLRIKLSQLHVYVNSLKNNGCFQGKFVNLNLAGKKAKKGTAKPLQTQGIAAKLLQQSLLWNQRLHWKMQFFIWNWNSLTTYIYIKPCKNTTAWSFLGMHWNCKSLGFILHPSGLRPLGWKRTLGICNFNASLEMIMQ